MQYVIYLHEDTHVLCNWLTCQYRCIMYYVYMKTYEGEESQHSASFSCEERWRYTRSCSESSTKQRPSTEIPLTTRRLYHSLCAARHLVTLSKHQLTQRNLTCICMCCAFVQISRTTQANKKHNTFMKYLKDHSADRGLSPQCRQGTCP